MVLPDTTPELVEVIRAKVPGVTGTSTIGAPLAMDFSMANGPPTSRKYNSVHSWLQDTVEVHQLLLDNIVCFATSDFGGAHAAFRLMITCAVWILALNPPPPYICRPYLAATDRAVRIAFFRILGVSQDVQTLDQLNGAKR
jgi:hypothetical protein